MEYEPILRSGATGDTAESLREAEDRRQHPAAHVDPIEGGRRAAEAKEAWRIVMGDRRKREAEAEEAQGDV